MWKYPLFIGKMHGMSAIPYLVGKTQRLLRRCRSSLETKQRACHGTRLWSLAKHRDCSAEASFIGKTQRRFCIRLSSSATTQRTITQPPSSIGSNTHACCGDCLFQGEPEWMINNVAVWTPSQTCTPGSQYIRLGIIFASLLRHHIHLHKESMIAYASRGQMVVRPGIYPVHPGSIPGTALWEFCRCLFSSSVLCRHGHSIITMFCKLDWSFCQGLQSSLQLLPGLH